MQFSVPTDRAERSPKEVGSIPIVRAAARRVQIGIDHPAGRSRRARGAKVRINGKYSIYSDYKNQKIPAIFILEDQKWKISLGYYIFYYLWKTIENSDRIPI